jgi:hypothetical protein
MTSSSGGGGGAGAERHAGHQGALGRAWSGGPPRASGAGTTTSTGHDGVPAVAASNTAQSSLPPPSWRPQKARASPSASASTLADDTAAGASSGRRNTNPLVAWTPETPVSATARKQSARPSARQRRGGSSPEKPRLPQGGPRALVGGQPQHAGQERGAAAAAVVALLRRRRQLNHKLALARVVDGSAPRGVQAHPPCSCEWIGRRRPQGDHCAAADSSFGSVPPGGNDVALASSEDRKRGGDVSLARRSDLEQAVGGRRVQRPSPPTKKTFPYAPPPPPSKPQPPHRQAVRPHASAPIAHRSNSSHKRVCPCRRRAAAEKKKKMERCRRAADGRQNRSRTH